MVLGINQAEADFQYKEVGAKARLPSLSDRTQAPGPEWQPFISLPRVSERGDVCVCTCVHMVRINMSFYSL